MFVYFMKSGKKGPVKIGKSGNPEKRMKFLQTGNPCKLELIRIIPCKDEKSAYSLEGRFHRLMKKRRLHGEWYHPSFSIKKLMETKLIKDSGLIAVEDGFIAI